MVWVTSQGRIAHVSAHPRHYWQFGLGECRLTREAITTLVMYQVFLEPGKPTSVSISLTPSLSPKQLEKLLLQLPSVTSSIIIKRLRHFGGDVQLLSSRLVRGSRRVPRPAGSWHLRSIQRLVNALLPGSWMPRLRWVGEETK